MGMVLRHAAGAHGCGGVGSHLQFFVRHPALGGGVSRHPAATPWGAFPALHLWPMPASHPPPRGSHPSVTGGSIPRPSLRACPGPRDTCPSGVCPPLHTLPPGFGLAAVAPQSPRHEGEVCWGEKGGVLWVLRPFGLWLLRVHPPSTPPPRPPLRCPRLMHPMIAGLCSHPAPALASPSLPTTCCRRRPLPEG